MRCLYSWIDLALFLYAIHDSGEVPSQLYMNTYHQNTPIHDLLVAQVCVFATGFDTNASHVRIFGTAPHIPDIPLERGRSLVLQHIGIGISVSLGLSRFSCLQSHQTLINASVDATHLEVGHAADVLQIDLERAAGLCHSLFLPLCVSS
jgi:hypothetical protein